MFQQLESARKLAPPAARLRRKLHLRRMKRALGLRVFNLDSTVSQSLRDTRPPPVPMPPVKSRTGVKLADGTTVPLRVAGMEEERALDRFQVCVRQSSLPFLHFILRMCRPSRRFKTLHPRPTSDPLYLDCMAIHSWLIRSLFHILSQVRTRVNICDRIFGVITTLDRRGS